jgi:hypothetical protein
MNEKMSENDTIFKEYLNEERGFSNFIRKPKSWLFLFSIVMGIIFLWIFYKSVIMDTMSPTEVTKSIEVIWQDTVWLEAGTVGTDIKVVPSIRFKIKNVGPKPLEYVNFEGVFRIEDTDKELGSGGALAFRDGLLPGEESDEIAIQSNFGYMGSSKANIMKNKEWKEVRVTLFARTKGSGPAAIGEIYPVKREIAEPSGVPGESAASAAEASALQKASFEKIGKSLQIVEHDSIWVEKSRVLNAKKVTLVPSITFRVKNVGEEPMKDVIFKGEFLFDDTGEKLSEGTASALKETLLPGETGGDISIRSDLGYDATSKEAFVQNPEVWRKVKVNIYARQLDYEYVLLGIYPIRQEVEGVKVVYELQQ